MRAGRRLSDVFWTVVADTIADLAGIMEEIRSESGTVRPTSKRRRPSVMGRPRAVRRVRVAQRLRGEDSAAWERMKGLSDREFDGRRFESCHPAYRHLFQNR